MNRFLWCVLLFLLTACQSTNRQLAPISYLVEQNVINHHLQSLTNEKAAGRAVQSNGSHYAREYIKQQLAKADIKPLLPDGYLQPFTYRKGGENIQGTNVLAFIPGKQSERLIILSAHYDHLGIKGSKTYHGADDNASGVSALLAVANVLIQQQPSCSYVLLFSDAEEDNLKGTKAFIEQFPNIINKTMLNINLDMLAGSRSTKRLHFLSYKINKLLTKGSWQQFKENHSRAEIPISRGFKSVGYHSSSASNKVQWYLASDHGVFYRKHIPFLYYGVGVHENYHTAKDSFERANKQMLWHVTNTIIHQILFLDQHIVDNS